MRDLNKLPGYIVRIQHPGGAGDHGCGAFQWHDLRIIASNGLDWDHVSVSRTDRAPTWEEMDRIHRLFFEDHEVAMQLHVPERDHINFHANCLHLWRPRRGQKIPLPPKVMV